MNIEKLHGEQPNSTDTSFAAARENSGSLDVESGSPFGKFKDANSLLTAYNSLQSEFTKKCQALSELQRKADNTTENVVPCYSRENWQSELSDFMESHQFAKKFSKEIAEEISSDKALANSPHSLQLAYARVLEKHYKDDDAIKNENVIKQVVQQNQSLREEIVKEYLDNLKKSPSLMSSNRGGAVGLSPFETPKNMKEAGEMARKLFN